MIKYKPISNLILSLCPLNSEFVIFPITIYSDCVT